ncbi:SGNH/GDSL hydrolase N-terminal domain-containing protein [Sphingobacterium thalpophilum]
MKEHVRGPVWSLGRNAAGLYIDFQTSASEIVV